MQSIGLIYLFLGTKSSLGMLNWRRWSPAQGNSPRRTTVTGRIRRSNVFCMYSQTFIGWSWNSHHIFRIHFANRVPSRFFLCSRCCQLTNVELVLVIVNIDTRDFVVFIVSEILYNIFELCKEWTAESWIVRSFQYNTDQYQWDTLLDIQSVGLFRWLSYHIPSLWYRNK